MDPNQIKRIYMIAICGTAMGSLAAMLKSRGYDVLGSDTDVYPPMSTFLSDHGIKVYSGFDEAHLDEKPDLVVIGNAMSRGNPEVEATLEQKLRYASLPEVLREVFIRGRRSITVTGTHGKTTTSALLAWIFTHAGRDPGFLLGGIAQNFDAGFRDGKGPEFIIEGDEYDTAFFDKGPKFLHYLPEILIVNNIEFDHADIYDNIDQIKLNFQRMVNIVPRNGLFLAGAEDENVRELLPRAFCPVQSFGLDASLDWHADDIETSENGVEFAVIHRGSFLGKVFIPMFGDHNIRNVLAAIAAGTHVGIDFKKIKDALAKFKSVKRRMELRGEVNKIKVYDDFAHHPTEVQATLNAMRKRFPNSKIWAIYEPRTATARRKIFQKKFITAFDDADFVLIAPVNRPDKTTPDNLFSIEKLISDLTERNVDSKAFGSVDAIVDFLTTSAKPEDIIITLSNGGFGGIHDKLLTRL